MKVAIYARISKERCNVCNKPRERCVCAEFKGQDVENQLRELREFCTNSGWTVCKEYIDHESAKTGDRGAFQQMLADAGKRKFKGVVCWALDRFTREGIGPAFDYLRGLKGEGVDFISYTEPHFRTTGPVGELMISIFAWIAKQERVRISERTRAGIVTARLKGKQIGRRVIPLDSERVLAMAAAGAKNTEIAAQLQAEGLQVSRETVRRLLLRSVA